MTEKTIPPIVTLDDDEPSKRTLEYFEERIKLSQLMLEFKKAAYETDALVYAALTKLYATKSLAVQVEGQFSVIEALHDQPGAQETH